eukprot:scaffold378572_cov20-Prasinocladus_malaysianus.AAC.1
MLCPSYSEIALFFGHQLHVFSCHRTPTELYVYLRCCFFYLLLKQIWPHIERLRPQAIEVRTFAGLPAVAVPLAHLHVKSQALRSAT